MRTAHAIRSAIASAVVLALAPLSALAAQAGTTAAPPHIQGTRTVAAYDYDTAIRERVEVEVPTDGDANGVRDRVTIDIIRPREAAAAGIDVPVIMQASPYYASNPPASFDGNGVRISYPTWLDNYFVPRGYAVIFADMAGTFRSTGCSDVGAQLEIAGTKAVVDWLNGRATGFKPDGSRARADWTNGKTGMIGGSWNGTIANSVASTGVRGLKTIVPIAAISSWYDYTRSFGVPFYDEYMGFLHDYVSNDKSPRCVELTDEIEAASDTPTGSYSRFWDPRNYNPEARDVRASVYVVHGLNDENVKTRHFGEWWDQLERYDVPRKIFLHQGVHIDSFSFRQLWVDRLHPWFDYWLQGLQNGVMKTPMATIQREDGSFGTERTWPAAGTRQTRLALPGSAPVAITGGQEPSGDEVVLDPATPRPDRALFVTDPLTSPVRVSGTGKLTVRVKVNRPAAGIKARLVDYGTATRFTEVANLPTSTCWGGGTAADTGCYPDTKVNSAESDVNVAIRTLADVGHYRTLYRKETLRPDRWYELTFELNADDVVFAAGHRVGLVLTVESDNPAYEFPGATVTVDPRRSALTLPLAGRTPVLKTVDAAQQRVALAASRLAQPEPETDPRKLIEQSIDMSR
jgi:X-Pro dipeptidyl-peptidase